MQDPCGCDPEAGSDETNRISHRESSRPQLLDQWKAHGRECFVSEEHDNERCQWQDESAEKT